MVINKFYILYGASIHYIQEKLWVFILVCTALALLVY